VSAVFQAEFGISQPAVSQHLKVLRDHGFATVRPAGTRRLYAVRPEALREADVWLDRFRHFWTPPLMALETELARGRRQRRTADENNEKKGEA
jgi:DNA-binding transcriptional ArsR family regulator